MSIGEDVVDIWERVNTFMNIHSTSKPKVVSIGQDEEEVVDIWERVTHSK